MQLRGAQRSHAGRAEDVDAALHGPQDFLVPHRRHMLENAVDNADRARLADGRGAVNVPLPRWRQAFDVQTLDVAGAQRRSDEEQRGHGCAAAKARARAPGT